MKKSKYWCDVCKEEKDFFDIREQIELPESVVRLTGEFIKTSFTIKTKKRDICLNCMDKIIQQIIKVIEGGEK